MCNKQRLKLLSFALAIILIFIGCATNKTASQNDIIGLNVDNVPEGIRLAFDYIPQETTRMFIFFEEPVEGKDSENILMADIRETALDQVKKNGMVICPFVQTGHNYNIAVNFESDNNENWIYAEIIANNGINVLNDIVLELNDAKTGITLSQEPVFSSDVQYAPQRYTYDVTVKVEEHRYFSFSGTVIDALAWDFSSMNDLMNGSMNDMYDTNDTNDIFQRDNVQLSGTLPVYVTAYCNLNYENLTWSVEIARSNEFTAAF
jgi:hypothetical protein